MTPLPIDPSSLHEVEGIEYSARCEGVLLGRKADLRWVVQSIELGNLLRGALVALGEFYDNVVVIDTLGTSTPLLDRLFGRFVVQEVDLDRLATAFRCELCEGKVVLVVAQTLLIAALLARNKAEIALDILLERTEDLDIVGCRHQQTYEWRVVAYAYILAQDSAPAILADYRNVAIAQMTSGRAVVPPAA